MVVAAIFAQNLIQRLKTGSHTFAIKIHIIVHKSNMAVVAILKLVKWLWLRHFWTDLHQICHRDQEWTLKLVSLAKLISHKILDGAGLHIEIHFLGHNWAISAYICTEFNTYLKSGPCGQICYQTSHTAKIQHGGGRHFDSSYPAVTLPFLNTFAPKLTQRSKIIWFHSQY